MHDTQHLLPRLHSLASLLKDLAHLNKLGNHKYPVEGSFKLHELSSTTRLISDLALQTCSINHAMMEADPLDPPMKRVSRLNNSVSPSLRIKFRLLTSTIL